MFLMYSSSPFKQNGMRLLSWNMLAQTGIKREQYPFASKKCLKKSYRRPLLIKEIQSRHPDIIALQEVDDFEYLTDHLNMQGYFEPKIHSQNGICILWHPEKFKLIRKIKAPLIPFKHIWDHDNAFLLGPNS